MFFEFFDKKPNDDIIKLHYDLQKYSQETTAGGLWSLFYVPID